MKYRWQYKFRYYWRSIVCFFFICPKCFSSLNSTRYGGKICPKCNFKG